LANRISGDGDAVADEIERKLLVERRVDGVVWTDEGDRVAIGRRAEYGLHADIAARAGPVLDDKLLPQMLRKILADDTRDDVVGAARRKRDDPVHRPRRIDFRRRDPRKGGERGSTRCQMQKSPTGKFHRALLPKNAGLRALPAAHKTVGCSSECEPADGKSAANHNNREFGTSL
jgi:hypothetical protein